MKTTTMLVVGLLAATAVVALAPTASATEYVCVPTQGCDEIEQVETPCTLYFPAARTSSCNL